MLAIRMQRTGRKGHAQFRVIVQDSRRTPSSGKVVEYLGSYNPHDKKVVLDKEKTELFLKNGAQPSPRVVTLLKSEKIKLPAWVSGLEKKSKSIRNPEKLRRNQPKETKAPEVSQDEPVVKEAPADQPEEKTETKEYSSNDEVKKGKEEF